MLYVIYHFPCETMGFLHFLFVCLFVCLCVCVLAGIMNEHVMIKPTITDTRWIWCATRAINQVLLIVTIMINFG